MKNKRLTYILVPLVLLIWGIIFYKIFTHLDNGNETPLNDRGLKKTIVNENDKDTFTIKANYKDPFLSGHQKPLTWDEGQGQISTGISGFSKKTASKPEIIIPDLRYFGLIYNENNKQKLGLFRLNNKDIILKEGQLFEELQIVGLFNDSVKTTFRRVKKTFKKNSN
jgi:hypothetical protein